MKRRIVKFVILFWFGWYLSGPVCEAFDSWDSAPEEMNDMLFHAGGVQSLLAAGFSVGIGLIRGLRRLCRALARVRTVRFVTAFAPKPPGFSPVTAFLLEHSPPVPLRI